MWPSRSGDLLVFPGYNIYMVGGLAHATFLLYWSHVIYVLYKSILLHEHLSHVSALESQFLSVSVSGMDSSVLLTGRPFGGCAILYRKSLAYSIIRLKPCSKRFCAVSKLLIP